MKSRKFLQISKKNPSSNEYQRQQVEENLFIYFLYPASAWVDVLWVEQKAHPK